MTVYQLHPVKEELIKSPLFPKDRPFWGYGLVGDVVEIAEIEFFNELNTYAPGMMTYCQIQDPERMKVYKAECWLAVHYFIYNEDHAIAFANINDTYKFYKVAPCIHDYKEVYSNHQGDHEYECTKCKKKMYIDSSG